MVGLVKHIAQEHRAYCSYLQALYRLAVYRYKITRSTAVHQFHRWHTKAVMHRYCLSSSAVARATMPRRRQLNSIAGWTVAYLLLFFLSLFHLLSSLKFYPRQLGSKSKFHLVFYPVHHDARTGTCNASRARNQLSQVRLIALVPTLAYG